MLHDAIGDRARFDLFRPAEEKRYTKGAFPVGVLLAAEWGGAGIWPGVFVRTVVGAVHDDGVFGDAELIEQIEHLSHVVVVIDHGVVIRRLPATGLTQALGLGVREAM